MKVKWGVIGCGGIAERRTLPGMMQARNAQLVAVMDKDLKAAERVYKEFNAKCYYDDIDLLLQNDEIDAVYIASPVFCHKEQCIKAARAKKHILLEKPMGLTVSEAREISEICKSEKVLLGVGFMMRFHSCHQKMRELIKEGKLGEIVSARAQLTCWYPEAQNCWRQDKRLSGGGALMDMGIHCIDLIRYITGLEVAEATGFVGNQIFKYNAEDAGTAVYKMKNGALCMVDASFNIPDDAAKCRIELYGTKGSIFAEGTISQEDSGKAEILLSDLNAEYNALQNRTAAKSVEINAKHENMYTKEIEAFSDAVSGIGEIPVTAEDAILSQQAIEAVYESSKLHKSIIL